MSGVSTRVQGTFEFEVQPLREYFCAKYLFKTAPYSPPGCEKAGTKPERFEAISRNSYWQNVVRFFAGCFDVGELPMLTQKLNELLEDGIVANTNYPYVIVAQLLSDYVFAQSPRNQKEAVKIIIKGVRSGRLTYFDGRRSQNEAISIPRDCGGLDITVECFEQLKKFPNDDYARELIALIRDNPYNVINQWEQILVQTKEYQKDIWFEYSGWLNILDFLGEELILGLVTEGESINKNRLHTLIKGRISLIDKHTNLKTVAFDDILDGQIQFVSLGREKHSLSILTLILHPYILSSSIFKQDGKMSYLAFIKNRFRVYPNKNIKDKDEDSLFKFPVNDEIDKKIQKFTKLITPSLKERMAVWRTDIELWDKLVEGGRTVFGDCWALSLVALIAAGIKSKERINNHSQLDDSKKSLCKRVRYARMKSGNIDYWKTQLENNASSDLALSIFFSWATPKTIISIIPLINKEIDSLPESRLTKISRAISSTRRVSVFSKAQQRDIEHFIQDNKVSEVIIYLLSRRVNYENNGKFVNDYINTFNQKTGNAIDTKLEFLSDLLLENQSEEVLEDIKLCYSYMNPGRMDYGMYYRQIERNKININLSLKISQDIKNYPRWMVALAEKSFRLEVNKHVKPVGEIAIEDKWFE